MTISLFNQALPHGITLSCRAAGAPDAPLKALFLHGFPEAAFVWDGVMTALAPDVRSVAPNLRGRAAGDGIDHGRQVDYQVLGAVGRHLSGCSAGAVAAQVGRHAARVWCQRGQHLVPHKSGFGKAMQ